MASCIFCYLWSVMPEILWLYFYTFVSSSPCSSSIPSAVSPFFLYPVIPTASLPPSIPSQVISALSRVDEWTYDMFELNLVTGGQPLSTLAFALFKSSGIVDLLMLDERKLAR